MKTNKLITNFLAFTTICFILLSCHSGPYQLEPIQIKVDSIHVPTSIVSNTPFEIDFFGTIGHNGCYKFEAFQNSINGNDLLIEAWGSSDIKSGTCPTVMVYLTGHNLTVTIPAPGDYNIKIKQPDNSILSRQITVK